MCHYTLYLLTETQITKNSKYMNTGGILSTLMTAETDRATAAGVLTKQENTRRLVRESDA